VAPPDGQGREALRGAFTRQAWQDGHGESCGAVLL